MLSQRDKVNGKLQIILDQDTELGALSRQSRSEAGDIPEQMQRAIAKAGESERERRARSFTPRRVRTSQKLGQDAAKVLETQPRHPAALPADLDRDRCREETQRLCFPCYRYY